MATSRFPRPLPPENDPMKLKAIAHLSFLSLSAALLALPLLGCIPEYPQCKKDKHCNQDLGETCVEEMCTNCQTDADCGADGLCAMHVTVGACGGNSYELACLTAASECRSDSCPQDPAFPECTQPCVIASGEWVCDTSACGPTSCG